MSLSTHCLNTTTGLPAQGLQVELVKLTVSDHGPDVTACLLYTSPSPRDRTRSRMPSSA